MADQGPGIADADLPHVFDRFYRADTARNTPGTGLGLSIVAQTVTQHGGWVRAGRLGPGRSRVHRPAARAIGLEERGACPQPVVPRPDCHALRPCNRRETSPRSAVGADAEQGGCCGSRWKPSSSIDLATAAGPAHPRGCRSPRGSWCTAGGRAAADPARSSGAATVQVVDRRRATEMGVGDQPELTERGQRAIDRRPVDAGRRCLGAADDLVGCQVLVGAVQHLDHGLAGPRHPLACGRGAVRMRRPPGTARLTAASSILTSPSGTHPSSEELRRDRISRCDIVASGTTRGNRLEEVSHVSPGLAGHHERARTGRRLSPGQKRRSIVGMAIFIALLHLLGWGTLIGIVAPEQYQVGEAGVLGIGLGLVAYTLGMRHAFDADHIAAIDNTTRKLMARRASARCRWASGSPSGTRPSCSCWSLLLAFGVRALAGQVSDEGSCCSDHRRGRGRRVRHILDDHRHSQPGGADRHHQGVPADAAGAYDETALEAQLNSRGFMNRILSGATKAVRKPWHMYPVGVLFGLGFDTATEIGLLVLAGGAAAFSLPWYAILTLPILFAAGMSLLDTLDGVFMNVAYGWAFAKPVRKVYYNITVTSLSVAVALIIGTIELISILTDKAGIDSGPLAAIATIDLDVRRLRDRRVLRARLGDRCTVWKYGRVEEKWSAGLQA